MPLSLADFAASLTQRATRTRTAAARSTATRAPSIGARFLADLRADCATQGMTGACLPLAPLARAWCDANYPTSRDRQTPWATLESQLRVAAKAGALPSDVAVISAKDAASRGLPHSALVVVLAAGGSAGQSLETLVRAQAEALEARDQ